MAAILTKGKLQQTSTFSVGYPTVRLEQAAKPRGSNSPSFTLSREGVSPPAGLGGMTVNILQYAKSHHRPNFNSAFKMITHCAYLSPETETPAAGHAPALQTAGACRPLKTPNPRGGAPTAQAGTIPSASATRLRKHSAGRWLLLRGFVRKVEETLISSQRHAVRAYSCL